MYSIDDKFSFVRLIVYEQFIYKNFDFTTNSFVILLMDRGFRFTASAVTL